jgi:hypothetical protein
MKLRHERALKNWQLKKKGLKKSFEPAGEKNAALLNLNLHNLCFPLNLPQYLLPCKTIKVEFKPLFYIPQSLIISHKKL